MKLLTRSLSMLALLASALPAAAQGEVVVYCTVQEEWCRPMVAAFEKATGAVDDKWLAQPIGPYVKKVITAARAK